MAYKVWHEIVSNFPKTSRYTLGAKIDLLILETIQYIFSSKSIPADERFIKIKNAARTFDSLKFFLQIAWEIKALDTKKYITISKELYEIGKMFGGWLKTLSEKTSPK